MNLFTALLITPELRDAISLALSALQQREAADLAVAANARSIEVASAAIPELDSTAARLHAEAIKCEALAAANGASKADVSKAVKAADRAALDLAENKRALERATAARTVLADMARDADTGIAHAKGEFTSALAAYREQPLSALEDDLLAACAGRVALRDVIAAARAVDAEFPGGLCTPILDNLKIISPRAYRISHDEIGRPRVSGTDLLAKEPASAALPEEAALALREINAIADALKRHKPFTMPKLATSAATPPLPARSAHEQRRYDEAAERIRQSEQEYDQRQRRSQQPQSEEQRRKWTQDVRQPGTPVPCTSQNRAQARALPSQVGQRSPDGNLGDEYQWLGETQPGM
ncbi:hypothetical protein J2801_002133 [Paraburkholderia phenoliruptrix]|uniref:hypothetical protein n=1 Tax=Paraburkholderia phenoliruptrix TaxID=252970 RepID=UPI0028591FF8|nr:hypothetical protein [Paraburkholderia phenoliruptrix]MDR6419882.1 hypothetical protein [Paraburkholderia phenoliruptrix]